MVVHYGSSDLSSPHSKHAARQHFAHTHNSPFHAPACRNKHLRILPCRIPRTWDCCGVLPAGGLRLLPVPVPVSASFPPATSPCASSSRLNAHDRTGDGCTHQHAACNARSPRACNTSGICFTQPFIRLQRYHAASIRITLQQHRCRGLWQAANDLPHTLTRPSLNAPRGDISKLFRGCCTRFTAFMAQPYLTSDADNAAAFRANFPVAHTPYRRGGRGSTRRHACLPARKDAGFAFDILGGHSIDVCSGEHRNSCACLPSRTVFHKHNPIFFPPTCTLRTGALCWRFPLHLPPAIFPA